MMTTRSVLGLLGALIAGSAGVAGAGEALPRYRFEPGQELAYRSSSSFKFGAGKSAGEHGSDKEWTVWVVRANKDGSFRLVLREKSVFTQTYEGKKYPRPPETQIVYADLFPDGRVAMNKTIVHRGHPAALFPQLPRDAKEAWRMRRPWPAR